MGKQKVYLDKNNEINFTCMTESDTRLLISFGDSDAVEYTTNIQEANYIFIMLGKPYDSASISEFSDVITNLRSYNPSATIVISGGMFHADESDNNHSLGVYSDIMAGIDSNCVALTLNHNYKYIESDNIRYYDFVFNRSRMSYFDHDNEYFKRMCHSSQWPLTYKDDIPYADAEAYQLADFTIDARNSDQRYNLGVLKTFLSSMYAREETIYSKNNSGHAMAGLSDPNIFLVRDAVRIDLKNQLELTLKSGFANNAPPSKLYFESSVISIYVETVLTNPDIFCVSEKTFVPLIQGHFILPFGVENFVSKLIKEYDVKIPDWIDWQYYDSEADNLTRWLKYKATVFNTLNKGEDFLWGYKMSEKGQRILRHNRDLFTRNKDSLLSAINT